jgi:hypothetical protein
MLLQEHTHKGLAETKEQRRARNVFRPVADGSLDGMACGVVSDMPLQQRYVDYTLSAKPIAAMFRPKERPWEYAMARNTFKTAFSALCYFKGLTLKESRRRFRYSESRIFQIYSLALFRLCPRLTFLPVIAQPAATRRTLP